LQLDRRNEEIFETHSPKYLFKALVEALRDRPEMRKRTQIVIAGPACDRIGGLIEECQQDDIVKRLGWISHAARMQLIRRCHAACVVMARGSKSDGWVPAKLYPYAASGTPILGLLPDGAAARIVHETESGVVVAPDDVEGIKGALMDMYDTYCKGERTNQHLNRQAVER
jgi:glycosyltransferase involved in cell wall biosynthesis